MTREEQYSFSDFGEDKAGGNKEQGTCHCPVWPPSFLLDNPNCDETET